MLFYNPAMPLFRQLFPLAVDLELYPDNGEIPLSATRFIWQFVRILRLPIIAIALCYSLGTAAMALEPWFFGHLVEALKNSSPETLLFNAGKVALAYILIAQIFQRVVIQIGHKIESHLRPVLAMHIRRRLSNYLYDHSYTYFQNEFSGRLAGRVLEMPESIVEILQECLGTVLMTLINGVAAATLFVLIDWRFGFPILLYLIGSFFLCYHQGRLIFAKADKTAAAKQIMRGRYIDSISNILLVKLFARESHERRLFFSAMIDVATCEQVELGQHVMLWRGQHCLNALLQITVIILAIWLYRYHGLTLGNVATSLGLGALVAVNAWWLLQTSSSFFSRFATIEEALHAIGQPHELIDAPATQAMSPNKSDIRISRLGFSYPGRAVFSDFSLNVQQGQRVGLVGPSGAGKSTLIQLLLRLFDVQDGTIEIGGRNIRDVSQADLRRTIAMIPQATDLMHRSVRDNIRYGNTDATDEEVIEAAKQAFIHDTIMALRDQHGNTGYDAIVGERGVKLSGGQRQRIAIARAVLKNAPILILDEATSALDSESEKLIQQSLKDLFQDKTVIAIAHRLSTIAHLDRIVVMEEGRIVEDGAHAELLAGGGLYARLWSLQSAGFIGAP